MKTVMILMHICLLYGLTESLYIDRNVKRQRHNTDIRDFTNAAIKPIEEESLQTLFDSERDYRKLQQLAEKLSQPSKYDHERTTAFSAPARAVQRFNTKSHTLLDLSELRRQDASKSEILSLLEYINQGYVSDQYIRIKHPSNAYYTLRKAVQNLHQSRNRGNRVITQTKRNGVFSYWKNNLQRRPPPNERPTQYSTL